MLPLQLEMQRAAAASGWENEGLMQETTTVLPLKNGKSSSPILSKALPLISVLLFRLAKKS